MLFDAHEDLAWNMLTFGRDYTRSAHETRRLEAESGSHAPKVNGNTLLGYPDYLRGQVGIVFGTLFAAPLRRKSGKWDTPVYADADEAHRIYRQELGLYHRLTEEHPDKFRLLRTRGDLNAHIAEWKQKPADAAKPVGLVVLMEGAEGVRSPDELPSWWEDGLRIIGLAWAGTRFCGGTGEPGPLTDEGRALLRGMADVGFLLDISHMDPEAAREAMETYAGDVIASHANPAALLPESNSNRFLPDDVIDALAARDGVIGIVPYNRFLDATWKPGDPRLPLEKVVEHIDYICQRTGSSRHVAIGSDFDGGFGVEMVPEGIDTVADLQKLAPLLEARGYTNSDIAAIFAHNWLRKLKTVLK